MKTQDKRFCPQIKDKRSANLSLHFRQKGEVQGNSLDACHSCTLKCYFFIYMKKIKKELTQTHPYFLG